MEFEKPLRVSKTEQYEVSGANLDEWRAGQPITSASAVCTNGRLSIVSVAFTANSITVFATGVTRGQATLVVSYSTATLSDSSIYAVRVIGETENAQSLIPSTLRARI